MTLYRSFMAKFLFGNMTPYLLKGRTKVLTAADMPPIHPTFHPDAAQDLFYSLPLHDGGWRFIRGILAEMRPLLIKMFLLAGLVAMMNLCSPILVFALVSFVATADSVKANWVEGIAVALGLCATSALFAMAMQHYFYVVLGNMQMIVNGLNARLYDKALTLSRRGRFRRPTGDVVNLMGTDADSVAEFIFAGTDLFYGLLTVIAVSLMLFHFLGVAAWAGLAVLVAVVPLTRYLVKRFTSLDGEIMYQRDQRVSLVSQIVSGIRIVKFFAWEGKMQGEVAAIRKKELDARRRMAYSGALSLVIYFIGSTLVGVVAFGVHLALGKTLDAATVFSCITLFGMLDQPFGHLTEWVAAISSAKVSADRIAGFLAEEEQQKTRLGPLSPRRQAIGLVWDKVVARYADGDRDAIVSFDLTIKPGEAVAIVGPVGAGKTSLLYTIIGEIPVVSGCFTLTGIGAEESPRLAFVPQESFILNDTLDENVRLGSVRSDHDERQLWEALTAAGLENDMHRLPGGLATEIGEHGVNLSGGQKQRLSLARADFAEPGLFLLDDPLSAVDFAMEDKLVEQLIFGRWHHATRIVVTHRLHHLARFDRVIFMRDGAIVSQGTYAEMIEQSPDFRSFMAETLMEERHIGQTGAQSVTEDAVEKASSARITEDEDREEGEVAGTLYRDYIKLLGGVRLRQRAWLLPALAASTILVTLLPIVQNTWLSLWTNAFDKSVKAGQASNFVTRMLYPWLGSDQDNLAVYAALGIAVLVAILGRYLLWMLRAIAAGQILHDRAFAAVLAMPLRFFDATPVGRILNRFSRDMDSVERELAWACEQTIRSAMQTIGAVLVLVALFPLLILILLPLTFMFRGIQASYRQVSREAQRLASIARSPRFAHFKETLTGTAVIRSYGREVAFTEKNRKVLADYQRMFHALVAFNRWFSIRIPVMSAALSGAVMVGILWSAERGVMLAGTAGLAIMYALRFWESLNWSIRSFSTVEAKMTSVERLQRFASMTPEAQVVGLSELDAQAVWPSRGTIAFEGLSARYASHLPLILRDVSFQVTGGQKVGVIGRTGAGKSTLFQVLYRFINPDSGRVLIDGIDTRDIPLTRLRAALAVIPQDPTLFKGSLRSNLDRFNQHSDAMIWRALERAHLDQLVRSLPQGLEAEVKENGHNFSQGQRQLFCLARALLQNARIIVMDEATASVDVETDVLIQRAIREECEGRTVLIIAHRLETVLDCDLILELSDGRLVYQGPPPSKKTTPPRPLPILTKNPY